MTTRAVQLLQLPERYLPGWCLPGRVSSRGNRPSSGGVTPPAAVGSWISCVRACREVLVVPASKSPTHIACEFSARTDTRHTSASSEDGTNSTSAELMPNCAFDLDIF